MTSRFNNFFPFIIKWEGSSYEDDPDDTGGATHFGIDQRSHPNVDIKNLTLEGAKQIYWNSYWLKVQADLLPRQVGEVVMDIAVNNGISRASRWLQQFCSVKQDGIIGSVTLEAANRIGKVLATDLLFCREHFYKSIAKGSQAKFLRGWLNRNNDLQQWIQTLQ